MARRDADRDERLYEQFEKARQGDARALDRLLSDLRPLLLRAIRPRVRSAVASEAVAEELTQDALLRVVQGLPGCRARTEGQLRAWCQTIARRRVIDWYRRRSEERERKSSGAQTDLLWGRAQSGGYLRGRELMYNEEVERVLGALLLDAQGELSEGTQQVLRRRLLYGETWQLVGEAVGTSPGGAKRRYQRAMDRLRREVLERIRRLADEELRRDLLRRVGQEPQ